MSGPWIAGIDTSWLDEPLTEEMKQQGWKEEKMKENELDTTIDEWRAEMNNIWGDDPGETSSEIAKKLGLSIRAAQKLIVELTNMGKCRSGTALKIIRGKQRRVPVYQLIPEKKVGK